MDLACRCPRINQNKTKVIYLASGIGGPHVETSKMYLYDFEKNESKLIIDKVDLPNSDSFPGLYIDQLPFSCWGGESIVYVASIWRSRKVRRRKKAI